MKTLLYVSFFRQLTMYIVYCILYTIWTSTDHIYMDEEGGRHKLWFKKWFSLKMKISRSEILNQLLHEQKNKKFHVSGLWISGKPN